MENSSCCCARRPCSSRYGAVVSNYDRDCVSWQYKFCPDERTIEAERERRQMAERVAVGLMKELADQTTCLVSHHAAIRNGRVTPSACPYRE